MPKNPPPKTSRRAITAEQRELILSTAVRSGLGAASKASGRPYITCYALCRRMGVKPKPFNPPDILATKTRRRLTTIEAQKLIASVARREGLTAAVKASGRPYITCYSICRRLGVTPKRFHPPVKPAVIHRAKSLWRRGKTLKQIGAAIGVSHTQARNFILREAA